MINAHLKLGEQFSSEEKRIFQLTNIFETCKEKDYACPIIAIDSNNGDLYEIEYNSNTIF